MIEFTNRKSYNILLICVDYGHERNLKIKTNKGDNREVQQEDG